MERSLRTLVRMRRRKSRFCIGICWRGLFKNDHLEGQREEAHADVHGPSELCVLPGSAYEAVEREDGGIQVLKERTMLNKDMGNDPGLLDDQGVYK